MGCTDFIIRMVTHWRELPREDVDLLSLTCSRSGWMWLWATWSSERCSCLWQRGWIRWYLKVHSNPKHSVIYSVILWNQFRVWGFFLSSV